MNMNEIEHAAEQDEWDWNEQDEREDPEHQTPLPYNFNPDELETELANPIVWAIGALVVYLPEGRGRCERIGLFRLSEPVVTSPPAILAAIRRANRNERLRLKVIGEWIVEGGIDEAATKTMIGTVGEFLSRTGQFSWPDLRHVWTKLTGEQEPNPQKVNWGQEGF